MNHADFPVFFVIGAAKAATSSLYFYLKQHPEIYMHEYKDVACYFCDSYGLKLTLDKFIKILTPPKNCNFQISGDVCHAYLSAKESAKKIAETFPEAKIISVLRDPVDRAYSLYWWMAREGYEPMQTFEKALTVEQLRMEGLGPPMPQGYKSNYFYFHSGLYSEQIERYIAHFDTTKLLFIKYELFKNDVQSIMAKVYSFLGVSSAFQPYIQILNPRHEPYSPYLQYIFRCKLNRLSNFLGIDLASKMLQFNHRKKKTMMNQETYKRLRAMYQTDLMRVQDLTGMDLSDWLSKNAYI